MNPATTVEVPADGSCLFWSVSLAYLLPVINNHTEFRHRFDNLFEHEEICDVSFFNHVYELLKANNSGLSTECSDFYEDSILKTLVSETLRAKVIRTLRLPEVKSKCLKTITLNDFRESHNDHYIASGTILNDLKNPNIENIDFSQLELKEAAEKVRTFLDSMGSGEKSKFLYEFYLKCMMENTSSWGGHHEILAMSYMLHCEIEVESKNGTNVIKWNDYDCKMHLFYNGTHYNFGLQIGNGTDSSEVNDESSHDRKLAKDIFSNMKECKPSGTDSLFHGPMYQIKLLLLCLKRAHALKLNFRLATEWKEAEKFDDLVFLFQNEHNEKSGCFLQAKHKRHEKDNYITYEQLVDEGKGEFGLQKYFISYMKMKNNPELKDIMLETFIIITNINFSPFLLKSNGVLKKFDPGNFITNIFQFDCKFLNKTPSWYRLIRHERIEVILRESSQVYQLAKELAEHVFGKKPLQLSLRTPMLKEFHKVLCKYVIDKSRNKFQENFILNENLSMEIREFRRIFISIVVRLKCLENINYDVNNVVKDLSNIKIVKPDGSFGNEEKPGSNDLPHDVVNEKDIGEFFEKLVFAVDQPNEEWLGMAIEREVSSSFNLSCSKDIADQVLCDVLNWFKKNQGVFITPEKGNEFFENAERIMSSRVGIGLNDDYKAKLKCYGNLIKFKGEKACDEILNEGNFNLIKSGEPLLTLIKIYHSIMKHKMYKAEDSHIIIDLDSMLEDRKQKCVLNAIGALNSNHLLVIYCNYTDAEFSKKGDKVRNLFDKLYEVIYSNHKKLLVVFHKEMNIQTHITTHKFSLASDQTSFSDLSDESYVMLLHRKVNFQGNVIELGDLIQDKKDWNEILDGKIITELIMNENELLEMGSAPLKLSQSEAAFAKRFKTIETENLLKALKLDAKEPMTEIFLFTENIKDSHAYFDRVVQLLKITVEMNRSQLEQNCFSIFDTYLNIDYTNCKKINIVLNEKEETNLDVFKKICYYNSKKFVYWLEIVNGTFYWLQVYDPQFYMKRQLIKQSVVVVENIPLVKMEKRKKKMSVPDISSINTFIVDEEGLANDGQQVVMMVAEPGMGKSTTLTRLSEYKLVNNWVFRLNLRDCEQLLLSLDYDYCDPNSVDEIIAMFLLNTSHDNVNNRLTLNLLKYGLKQKMSKSLLILFDGYDEISKSSQTKTEQLINYLKAKLFLTLWISSRKEHTKRLENTLDILSTTFKELLPEERYTYLKNFYQVRLKLQLSENDYQSIFQSDTGKFDAFFKPLLKKVDMVLNETLSKFMGIPLQLRLLAESFQPEFEKFIDNNNSSDKMRPNFKNLDVLHFYQRFIDVKYKIYFQEKTKLAIGLSRESKRWLSDDLNRIHQRVALKQLFPGRINSLIRSESAPFLNHQFKFDPEQEIELRLVGILHVNPLEERLEFIHQTFAEYFVAEFLLDKLKENAYPRLSEAIQKLLLNILSDHRGICLFLNEQITETDISHVKFGYFDNPSVLELSQTLTSFEKLARFILTFYKNKTWLLKELNFHRFLHWGLRSESSAKMMKNLIEFTKNHYDVVRKCLLDKPCNRDFNRSQFLRDAASDWPTKKKSNVGIVMSAIKCYPKIIQEVVKDYYIADLCDLFQDDTDLCQLITKLKGNDATVMTSYEALANGHLRTLAIDYEKNSKMRMSKKYNRLTYSKYRSNDLSYNLKRIELEYFKSKPYQIRIGRDLKIFETQVVKILSKNEEKIKSNGNITTQLNAGRYQNALIQSLTQYNAHSTLARNIIASMCNKNIMRVDVKHQLDWVLKLVKNGDYINAKKKLQSLTHFPIAPLWFSSTLNKVLQQILNCILNKKQESLAHFLFNWFSSDNVISMQLFCIVFYDHPEYMQLLINSMACAEMKELLSYLLSILGTNLKDSEIREFSEKVLSAIEKGNYDDNLRETLFSVEGNNADDIIKWIYEKNNPNCDTKFESKNNLKNVLQLLRKHGNLTLYTAFTKGHRSIIEQVMNCMKHFPRIFHCLIFNARFCKSGLLSNHKLDTFYLNFELIFNAFPKTAACLVVLVNNFCTPLYSALKNNSVTFINLVFDILNPYPNVLKHLILTPTPKCKNCLQYAILKMEKKSLEVFLTQLNRNMDVMEHVVPNFVLDEEDKFNFIEMTIENNTDALLLFFNSFKSHIRLFRKFFSPSGEGVKPATYLAGERGCKEVMDVLLRVLKSEGDMLWQLLIWIDPSSGKTVIHKAAERGYTEIVDALFSSIRKQKQKLETLLLIKDSEGHTVLDCAIRSEVQIIRNDFNVDLRCNLLDSEDYKIMKDKFGKDRSIESLVKLSSDLKNMPMVVNLILIMAKNFNKVELMLVMFENKDLKAALESMNVTLENYSYNLFYCSIQRESVELINRLVAKGMDVNCWNGYGYTPLMKAVQKANANICMSLLSKGADIYINNMHGKSAYSMASTFNDKSKIHKLFDNK